MSEPRPALVVYVVWNPETVRFVDGDFAQGFFRRAKADREAAVRDQLEPMGVKRRWVVLRYVLDEADRDKS